MKAGIAKGASEGLYCPNNQRMLRKPVESVNSDWTIEVQCCLSGLVALGRLTVSEEPSAVEQASEDRVGQ